MPLLTELVIFPNRKTTNIPRRRRSDFGLGDGKNAQSAVYDNVAKLVVDSFSFTGDSFCLNDDAFILDDDSPSRNGDSLNLAVDPPGLNADSLSFILEPFDLNADALSRNDDPLNFNADFGSLTVEAPGVDFAPAKNFIKKKPPRPRPVPAHPARGTLEQIYFKP